MAKEPAPIEVINDRDDQIVNVFKQLRNKSKALCRAIALTPYAHEELEIARSQEKQIDPLEKARRFLVATMMTVNGTVGGTRSGFSFSQSYARENREARVNRWYNLPERLEQVVERLRNVRIEKRDARELVEMFADRPATLIYLDPPYFIKRVHGYGIDAKDRAFHAELLEICSQARCMILISGYRTHLYNTMLKSCNGWKSKQIRTNTRDTRGTDYARTEVLWMNTQFVKTRNMGRVPIRLSKKERSENKINPPRSG
jgi:DNA adenine methylase